MNMVWVGLGSSLKPRASAGSGLFILHTPGSRRQLGSLESE